MFQALQGICGLPGMGCRTKLLHNAGQTVFIAEQLSSTHVLLSHTFCAGGLIASAGCSQDAAFARALCAGQSWPNHQQAKQAGWQQQFCAPKTANLHSRQHQ